MSEPGDPIFEEEGGGEIIEFQPKALLKLMTSESFIEALKVAGWETLDTARETCFKFCISPDGNVERTDIKRGESDRVGHNDEVILGGERSSFDSDVAAGKLHEFLGLHFHPDVRSVLAPSETDLHELNVRSLEIICTIHENKNVDALLVKINKFINPSEVYVLAKEYEDELKDEGILDDSGRSNDTAVQEILRKNGFENIMLSYVYDKKKRKYILPKLARNNIKEFGTLEIRFKTI